MPGGRPTIMDEITLQKLEGAFANDATDEQACFIANISQQTLYNYQKEHPEFIDRKKALKSMVSYQAKYNLKELIYSQEKELEKERIEASKWILPKREKDIYSERNELTGKDGKDLTVNVIKYGDNNPTPQVHA
jgi:hypothetical protein